ncbi:MAG: hypothetical protein K2W96_07145, partial [Gemmataceae bacterium]|nr:hypothetical protein [Gemmataceae bacterium]
MYRELEDPLDAKEAEAWARTRAKGKRSFVRAIILRMTLLFALCYLAAKLALWWFLGRTGADPVVIVMVVVSGPATGWLTAR